MHYVIGFAASLVEELCINSYSIGFIIDSMKEISSLVPQLLFKYLLSR